jgi:uncharacterized membrane protein YqaE (UPF0057 family)
MKQLLGLVIVLFAVSSCGIYSNDFSGGGIQKRKYTRGFYLNKRGHLKSGKQETVNSEELAENAEDDVKESLLAETFSIVDAIQQQTEPNNENQTDQSSVSTENKAKKKTAAAKTKKESRPTQQTQRKPHEPEYYMPYVNLKERSTFSAAASSDPVMTILLVILAIILPPLAVAIYEGITKRFWIDLVLFIIGIGVGFWLFGGGIAWLCALAAVIYALLIVLEVI